MTVETLLASGIRTVSGVGTAQRLRPNIFGLVFMLDVTNADTDAGDTLNVYIQESPDEGTTWNDIVSFTQVIGTGSAAKYIAKINSRIAPETELGAVADASLAAGSVLQGIHAPYIRAKWVIVDSGTDDATFTFSIIYNILK